jgi:hypothetical protein
VTGLINAVLCFITHFVDLVVKAVIVVINFVISAAAYALAALVSLLPGMPAFPTAPTGFWAWANWALPLSGIVALVGGLLTFLLAFLGIRIVLNWLRAL